MYTWRMQNIIRSAPTSLAAPVSSQHTQQMVFYQALPACCRSAAGGTGQLPLGTEPWVEAQHSHCAPSALTALAGFLGQDS